MHAVRPLTPPFRAQPPTVIFHLTARYKADTHPKKLNLGVGAYRDEQLRPYVFSAVRKAEAAVVAAGFDKEYLPIAGLPEFRVRALARGTRAGVLCLTLSCPLCACRPPPRPCSLVRTARR